MLEAKKSQTMNKEILSVFSTAYYDYLSFLLWDASQNYFCSFHAVLKLSNISNYLLSVAMWMMPFSAHLLLTQSQNWLYLASDGGNDINKATRVIFSWGPNVHTLWKVYTVRYFFSMLWLSVRSTVTHDTLIVTHEEKVCRQGAF